MSKHKIILEDGRYLIYYSFGKKERPANSRIPNPKSQMEKK